MRRLTRPVPLAIAGVGLALLAFLAFGVFGIHTAFIDERVDEADPFSVVSAPAAGADAGPDTGADAGPDAGADPGPDTDADAEAGGAAAVEELARGTLVDRSHSGEGTAVVLTDGDRRFLRFEEDFAIDNGPDLNVYLVSGADADSDAGTFDDDFVDLGDLKGNIGAQNYEIPDGVDLDRYDTVVIWCVRFGVAFNAADLV